LRSSPRLPSPAQNAPPALAIRQIAVLKASAPHDGDHFGEGGSLPSHTGNAVAVSADGTTLVVGAPHESSASRGINGNQNDSSLYSSGAVYVFTRRGDSISPAGVHQGLRIQV
jgi:hypothetical protein